MGDKGYNLRSRLLAIALIVLLLSFTISTEAASVKIKYPKKYTSNHSIQEKITATPNAKGETKVRSTFEVLPPIEIISLNDNPELIKTGELLNLVGKTLTFTPINQHSYSWKKSDLIWEDYQNGVQYVVPASSNTFSQQIDLSLSFPFFNYSQQKITLDSKMNLNFENKNDFSESKPCYPQDNYFVGCSPKIMALNTFIPLGGKAYVQSKPDHVTITYISNSDSDKPYINVRIQYQLWNDGIIKISYREVDNPLLSDFVIGIHSGKGEIPQEEDFNNKDNNAGGSATNYNSGMVGLYKGIELDNNKIKQIILNKHPEQYFDFVIISTDFTQKVNGAGGQGASLGAVTSVQYNDVKGTGLWITDCTPSGCNNKQNIKALLNLNNFKGYPINYLDKNNDLHFTLLHEFMHRWGVFIEATSPSNIAVDSPFTNLKAHWKIPLKSALDSNCWSSITEYAIPESSPCFGYSQFDLYLMGLMSATEVQPSAGLTIEYIIQKQGTRAPSIDKSQKTFNILPVFITYKSKSTFEQEDWKIKAKYQHYMNAFSENFHLVTLGRGSLIFNQIGSPTSIIN